MDKASIQINLSPGIVARRFFLFFSSLAIVAVILDYFFAWEKLSSLLVLQNLFAMNKEMTLCSWLSAVYFLLLGGTCLVMACRESAAGHRWQAWDWRSLGFFFCFLSFDDASHIHERLGSAFSLYAKTQSAEGNISVAAWLGESFPSYFWQVLYMPVLGIIGSFFFIKLWKELKNTWPRILLVLAFSVLALAEGLDFLEGLVMRYYAIETLFNVSPGAIKHSQQVVEEFLELIGVNLLTTLLVWRITETISQVTMCIKAEDRSSPHVQ